MQPRCHLIPVTLLVYILLCSVFFPTCTVVAAKNKTTKASKIKATSKPNQKQNNTFVPCQAGELVDSGCRNGASCLVKHVNGLTKVKNLKSKLFGGIQYKCVCRVGFKGTKCEKAVCTKEICKNGGKCHLIKVSSTNKTQACDCKETFGGQFCEEKLAFGTPDKFQDDLMIREDCKKGANCKHGKCRKFKDVFEDLQKEWIRTFYERLLLNRDRNGYLPQSNLDVSDEDDRFYENARELAGGTPSKFVCYCERGYDGPYCTKKCDKSERLYGRWCLRLCSRNCKKNKCDPKTGYCSPCLPGWKDKDCLTRRICKTGTSSCKHGQCIQNFTCACDPGYFKLTCDTPCRKRTDKKWKTWGDNCSKNCGWCIVLQCDEVTGLCKPNKKGEYCLPGWTGERCNLRRTEVEVKGQVEFTAASSEIASQSEGVWNQDDLDVLIPAPEEDDNRTRKSPIKVRAQRNEPESKPDTDEVPLRTRLLQSVQNWFQQASTSFTKATSGTLTGLQIRRTNSEEETKQRRRQAPNPTLTMDFTMGYSPEAVEGVNVKARLTTGLKAERDSFNVPGLTVNEDSIRISSVEQKDNSARQSGVGVGLTMLQAVAGAACALVLLTVAAVFMFRRNTKQAVKRQRGGGASRSSVSQGAASKSSRRMSHSSAQRPSSHHHRSGHSVGVSRHEHAVPAGVKNSSRYRSDI